MRFKFLIMIFFQLFVCSLQSSHSYKGIDGLNCAPFLIALRHYDYEKAEEIAKGMNSKDECRAALCFLNEELKLPDNEELKLPDNEDEQQIATIKSILTKTLKKIKKT